MMPWLFVSGRPWDAPGAWTADALVTFEGGGGRLRTDGMEIRVIQEPGESRLAVRQKVESVIRRMDAVEAVVTHLRPPMSLEMIRFIQLYNTDLAREQRSRRSLQSR